MLMMPSDDAKKEMMACARSKMNPDNSFFVEKETGEIKNRAYRDVAHISHHAQKEPTRSTSKRSLS